MNAPAWVLLAWHFGIFAIFVYAARRFLTRSEQRQRRALLLVSIVGLMALAPCVVIPAFAEPGSQPGLTRLITFLSMPAIYFATYELLSRHVQPRGDQGN